MTNELKIDDCVSERLEAQLWADVGGTFTDCFCVVDDVRSIHERMIVVVAREVGNLVDAAAFRGGDSILSGPAGGVDALGKIADAFAPQGAIGLDMGGTSTDVCRYSGRIPRDYESREAGVRVLAPILIEQLRKRQYIDWKYPENNVYHVADEFEVERMASHELRRPDVVLFVTT